MSELGPRAIGYGIMHADNVTLLCALLTRNVNGAAYAEGLIKTVNSSPIEILRELLAKHACGEIYAGAFIRSLLAQPQAIDDCLLPPAIEDLLRDRMELDDLISASNKE